MIPTDHVTPLKKLSGIVNLKALFPHASKAFVDANSGLSNPKLERDSGPIETRANEGEKARPKQLVLRYTSYRCSIITDDENICTKFLTDALRYCGALSDDTRAHVKILPLVQIKVEHRNEEKTLIELFEP